MAVPVIMPRQGQSVESCIIAKWHKKIGDRVEVGDILFSYETDKASFDEEAKTAGTMLAIFFEEGDDVPCLMNVCVIGNAGESIAEFDPNASKNEAASAVSIAVSEEDPSGSHKAIQAQHGALQASVMLNGTVCTNDAQSDVVQASAAAVASTDAGMVKISPRAKNLAERSGLDYRYASPSGPGGRIIERDLTALRDSGMIFTAAALKEQLKDSGDAGRQEPGAETGALRGGTGVTRTGSGLGGRITTADLASGLFAAGTSGAATLSGATALSGVSASPAASVSSGTPGAVMAGVPLNQPFEEVKMTNIRKVIARTMHQSLSSMAQLTLNTSFDISEILDLRKKLKEGKEKLGLGNITINDIVIYAISRTLAGHKALNAHFLEDRLLCFKNANIGVAVDTDRGLMVPTLFNANLMSLDEISAEVKKLVKECQAGTINPDLLKNGTFTVTNLGTLDVESFTPVINPPQTGILGVNNIMQRAREVDGKIEFYPAMGLSLTFDHRALDGAPAARFLKDLKTGLENFSALLAKA
jgi:pyruvate dehydrogenase E2 component (dihydrolipoamide acetyltransferase)